ncbi:piwi domain-containing protein [Rhizophagus clarus]|uniref:Piwi domain-containing protein n=1 Tax=Rhizophagus clarus TaxID=94130 RepID=A0A8H3LN04_9GLOM|nr:piwi domain-containing protein [Rhizophagus clarus]
MWLIRKLRIHSSSTYLLRTSRPAYYYVLFDEKGFNADSLQALSYNPCVYMRVVRVLYLWSSDLLCPINLHARDDLLI